MTNTISGRLGVSGWTVFGAIPRKKAFSRVPINQNRLSPKAMLYPTESQITLAKAEIAKHWMTTERTDLEATSPPVYQGQPRQSHKEDKSCR